MKQLCNLSPCSFLSPPNSNLVFTKLGTSSHVLLLQLSSSFLIPLTVEVQNIVLAPTGPTGAELLPTPCLPHCSVLTVITTTQARSCCRPSSLAVPCLEHFPLDGLPALRSLLMLTHHLIMSDGHSNHSMSYRPPPLCLPHLSVFFFMMPAAT